MFLWILGFSCGLALSENERIAMWHSNSDKTSLFRSETKTIDSVIRVKEIPFVEHQAKTDPLIKLKMACDICREQTKPYLGSRFGLNMCNLVPMLGQACILPSVNVTPS